MFLLQEAKIRRIPDCMCVGWQGEISLLCFSRYFYLYMLISGSGVGSPVKRLTFGFCAMMLSFCRCIFL